MQTALTKGKELNELKSKFVSMLSHEIRNPLSQILSSAEILEMFINEMSENEKLELIRKIQKTVDHLTDILNDSVNIDNPQILDKEIKLSEFDAVKFCEKLIEEIKVQYEECPVIHFEPENYRIMVSSDINSLQQIITNLITNSIKFTPKEKNIFLKIKTDEKSLILNLLDEGKGIDYFDQPKIFEPFFKGRNSENTIGSGLGLTLVKRTVASLKGNIEFESRPEEGTNFTVTIPIK
jgi:signal transduction histidine kinase